MRARRWCALLADIGLLVGTTALCAAQTPVRNQVSSARARSEAADKADFETVCGACHTSSMVSDIRTEPEWKEIVEHMVSIGADGTDEQLEAVMRVLLRTLTKVNVNTATAEQLPLVLDISEATAQAVVKYRAGHGDFKTLDDLKKVPGINAAKLDTRKDRIAF
ncbi:MAG TPA: ComEA family DNA-binding protein [Bryobacteraceae bacterium]|nr:ComEA family DNA-binding protein [Bryobacteraceae bacterium]